MSNIYILEPPTSGKVVLKTSVGDIELELWAKEAPKACRNFIQLCMEGYYDNTIFHRVVKGFIAQGGDPTGTGEGGQSVYGGPFKDEFHTRLRFCRRGLLAMANAGKDDNGSQFFFTLGATPELQNKHTIFGKVTGETLYNMLKLEDALVDLNDRPQYPQKIIRADVITNPFQDIIPRVEKCCASAAEDKAKLDKLNKPGVKNFKLLSFGEEAEEDEEETVVLSKQYSVKSKSAHDNLADPKLSSEPAIKTSRPEKRKKTSEDDEEGDDETSAVDTTLTNEARDRINTIKNKLKDKKSKQKEEEPAKAKEEVEEDEEYYFGKIRDDERKQKVGAIRKEIRELKRGVQNEKKAKEAQAKQLVEAAEEKKEVKSSDRAMKEYMETQVKYKETLAKVPKKGPSREDFALSFIKKFQAKLQNANEKLQESEENGVNEAKTIAETDLDINDQSWMTHALHSEEKTAVLAKDASKKDDDWFEIYDPRNPLNKRRRGETNTPRSRKK